MATVYFESLEDCDLVEVEFVNSYGGQSAVRLFVDSGFTGASSFVLSDDLRELALANLSSAHAGALTGRQQRVLVRCSNSAISFVRNLSAILAMFDRYHCLLLSRGCRFDLSSSIQKLGSRTRWTENLAVLSCQRRQRMMDDLRDR